MGWPDAMTVHTKCSSYNTIPATNTLKGVAISVVLINHYMNGHYSVNLVGIANAFVSIFFMMSGYGLYHSLNASTNEVSLSRKTLASFYYGRALRIFPLFWLALVSYKMLSLQAIVGLRAPGHLWFIPALLQCYVLAPFIAMVSTRINGL
jgi:peptidoglycan/LPS O-acetylase OafA/YrhL